MHQVIQVIVDIQATQVTADTQDIVDIQVTQDTVVTRDIQDTQVIVAQVIRATAVTQAYRDTQDPGYLVTLVQGFLAIQDTAGSAVTQGFLVIRAYRAIPDQESPDIRDPGYPVTADQASQDTAAILVQEYLDTQDPEYQVIAVTQGFLAIQECPAIPVIAESLDIQVQESLVIQAIAEYRATVVIQDIQGLGFQDILDLESQVIQAIAVSQAIQDTVESAVTQGSRATADLGYPVIVDQESVATAVTPASQVIRDTVELAVTHGYRDILDLEYQDIQAQEYLVIADLANQVTVVTRVQGSLVIVDQGSLVIVVTRESQDIVVTRVFLVIVE